MKPRTSWPVLLMLLAAPAASQWDSIPSSGEDLHVEGFLALHDNDLAVHAFSALTQRWGAIAPPGSEVIGTGDWTALLRVPGDQFVAYSARRDDLALLTVSGGDLYVAVEDDVALVVDYDDPSGIVAHAYSAETNMWQPQPLAAHPAIVHSRFVITCRVDAGGISQLFGFGARFGTWQDEPGAGCSTPQADGNVSTWDYVDPLVGSRETVAFSGVLNVWTRSPNLVLESVTDIDHNVALVLATVNPGPGAPAGGLTAYPCAYSAYTGEWVCSPNLIAPPAFDRKRIGDNVILLERIGYPAFEAFGARPAGWNDVGAGPLAGFQYLGMDEDVVLLDRPHVARVFAFSGVSGGVWRPEDYAGTLPVYHGDADPAYMDPDHSGPDHMALVSDTDGDVHAFSPAQDAWATVLSLGPTLIDVDDAIAVVHTAKERWAWSARWNEWRSGPSSKDWTTVELATGGSLACLQMKSDVFLLGKSVVWNERRNSWVPALGSLPLSATLHAGRNLMLVDGGTAGGGVRAYSLQRNTWSEAPGVVGPIATGAIVTEENVACVVDAVGTLHAYAAPADIYLWYAYPNDTEYQARLYSAAPPGETSEIKATVRATGGDHALWAYALDPLFAGLALPGIDGPLLLDPASLSLVPVLAVVDWRGFAHFAIGLPPSDSPSALQIWSQGAWDDAPGLALTPDMPAPAFIF